MDTLVLTPTIPPGRTKSHRKPLSKEDWTRLKKARKEAINRQMEGFESSEIFKLSVEAKLQSLEARIQEDPKGASWWENFQRCGRDTITIMCLECQRTKVAAYQCGLKWCPFCNWRISDRRRRELEKITAGISGCKHVVLTQRNFAELTPAKIRESRANLLRIRRSKIFGKISGGCASLEFTNEGRGWHMHWHLLVQSPFIPANELSIVWGKLVGQEFAVVKVLDVSDKSYVAEVCKYAVKGAELAGWKPDQILDFILAIRSVRCFTVFGKFADIRKVAKMHLRLEKPPQLPCECGCNAKIVAPDLDTARRIFASNYGMQ